MKNSLHASVVVVSLLAGSLTALAMPSGFELDLKELPQSGTTPSPQPREREQRKRVKSAPDMPHREISSYIVQPGDHLFLILMKQYGLSNDAAERLIPEVMSINNIHSPHGLTKGQKLTIPLPARSERMARNTRVEIVAENPVPAAVLTTKKAPALPAEASTGVEISAASSCALGREFAEKFNLLVPSPGIIQGFPNFTAGHAGLTVTVACGGLAPEEVYTYAQLLARHGIQLLVFTEEEPHRRIIEKLANRLSLHYQLDEPAGHNRLPLKVLFPSVGPGQREMRLTVLANNN